MKFQRLLLFCMAAWILAGCTGECSMNTVNYYFANATDKAIEVEAYYDDGYNPVKVHHSFSVPPHGEVLISGKYFPGRVVFFPFSYCNRIRLFNGEKTAVQRFDSEYEDCLFELECYEKFSCKRKSECYRYTFTEEDFEDGTPVTE